MTGRLTKIITTLGPASGSKMIILNEEVPWNRVDSQFPSLIFF